MEKSEILAAIKALEVSFTTYHQNFRKFLNDFDSRLANLTNTSPPSTLPLPLQPTINDVPEKLQISTPIAAPRLVAPTEPPLLFPNHHHLSFSHQNPSPPDLITNPQISPRNSHRLSLKSVNLSLTALRRVAVAAQPSRPNPFISSTHNHHRFHCLLHSLPRLPAPPPLPPPPWCCLNSCTKPILLVLYGRAITWVEEPPGFELFSVAVENRHFLGNSSEKGSSYLSEACVFTSASSYTFNTKNRETHLVRLNFSPFTSGNHDLRNVNFGVSTNGISLLLTSRSNITTIKEFFDMVDKDELEIMFMPSSDSDFGFANAIEVFSTPKDFFIDAGGITLISPEGMAEFKQNVSSQVLETVHRINVGGRLVTPFNDTLWRSWIPDEDFLVFKSAAKVARTSDPPNYESGGSTREISPDTVNMTAQQMNVVNGSLVNHFIINWNFPVRIESSVMHLVHLHFCDIVSIALNTLYFNKYINEVTAFKKVDWTVLAFFGLASPFYIDFFVKNMKGFGVFLVSVGPSDLSKIMRKNAGLKGVEVVRMVDYVPLPISLKKKNRWIVLGSVVGGLFVLSVGAVMILAMLICRKRKLIPKARCAESGGWTSLRAFGGSSLATIFEGTDIAIPDPYGYYDLKIPFADLQSATNNFGNNLMIGSGGFGMVYKGVLKDTMKEVVKRGVSGSKQGVREFQTEITVLSKIRQRHLISLVGYCKEQSEMILVYEYMEKGQLRNHLYGNGLPPLSWKRWLEICIGAARGLHYLHTGSTQGIIHCDIKSTNILLDQNNRLVARLKFKGIDKLRASIRKYEYQNKYSEAAIRYWTGAVTLPGFFSEDNDKVVKKQEFIKTTREHSVTFLVAKFDGILGLGFKEASVGNANPVLCFLVNWKSSFLDQIDQPKSQDRVGKKPQHFMWRRLLGKIFKTSSEPSSIPTLRTRCFPKQQGMIHHFIWRWT